MASYDLLKTLTIDGTTMGLDEDLGKIYAMYKAQAITAASTWIQGATITLNDPGVYLIIGDWEFFPSSSTAYKTLECAVEFRPTGAATGMLCAQAIHFNTGNVYGRLEAMGVYRLTAGHAPATVVLMGRSTRTSGEAATRLAAVKLISTVGA